MKYVITGSPLAGNLGGTAMIATTIQEIGKHDSNSEFVLLSYIPAQCAKVPHKFKNFTIVSADYRWLLLVFFPLSVALYPVLQFSAVRYALGKIPYFKSLYEADFVIDLSGIAFVDKRGLALLLYNAACVFPALGLGKRVFKLSQALGPFRQKMNRRFAAFILSRCEVVIARGHISYDHCRALGLENAHQLPDVSFGLEITEAHEAEADRILAKAGVANTPIIYSPSEVLRREMKTASMDFEAASVNMLKGLADLGHQIVVLPHSVSDDRTKNNDLPVSKRLKDMLGDQVTLISGVTDPAVMRAILGRAVVHVGCRFHSVVGALSMGTPTFIIGWSHKYDEMVAPICGNEFVIKWQDFEGDETSQRITALIKNHTDIRKKMADNLQRCTAESKNNFAFVTQ